MEFISKKHLFETNYYQIIYIFINNKLNDCRCVQDLSGGLDNDNGDT